MCGIFAISGKQSLKKTKDNIINGLIRLERRGYDSCGMAILQKDKVVEYKRTLETINEGLRKAVSNKEDEKTEGHYVGISHTRWATHGSDKDVENAHPQNSLGSEKGFFVVHNGMINNYQSIKTELEDKDYKFKSETDTEVLAMYAQYLYDNDNSISFVEIAKIVREKITGSSAVIMTSTFYPGELVGFKKENTPLYLGIIKEGDKMDLAYDEKTKCNTFDIKDGFAIISSDYLSIEQYTNKVILIKPDYVISLNKSEIKINNLNPEKIDKNMKFVYYKKMEVGGDNEGYKNFMIKEIMEQDKRVEKLIHRYLDSEKKMINIPELESQLNNFKNARRFLFISCGTSYCSSYSAKRIFETLTNKPCHVELATKFISEKSIVYPNDVVIFITQSGETADTLKAMVYCKKKKATCILLTNTEHSSMGNIADTEMNVHAGPEYAIASTKAYTTQYVSLVMMGLYITQHRKKMNKKLHAKIISELPKVPEMMSEALKVDLTKQIDFIDKETKEADSILIISEGWMAGTCYEAALKIKETNYTHAEGIQAGELKHGPIALIGGNNTVIMIIVKDHFYDFNKNIYEMIISRGGNPLVVCTENIKNEFKNTIVIPKITSSLQGLISVIPFQRIAYERAIKKGINPDKPRNLAKSVTV